MNRAEEKSIRLLQIEQLLWAHPEGLTRAEIARRLGVDRSVITKYLNLGHLPPSIYEDDLVDNKLRLDRSADLTKASFSLHEVMAIHLATRLLATRFDKYNPHAASALRKLGIALQRLDRNVSQHLIRSADVIDEESAFRDPVYLDVLEKLTVAWAAGRKVKITHRTPNGWVADYIIAPYMIEPYAVGQTAHVIGFCEPPGALRTLKIERIRSAEILSAEYKIPDDFDPKELLRDAWGIWYTEDEPQKVVLRFHPRVVSRVKESRWHASQQLAEQTDGYLVWTANIAETQEMFPWIRGWGADVEVLEPKELRESIQYETRKMARIYSITVSEQDSAISRLLRCWGKTGKNAQDFHPALFHMLDVGHVARALLSEKASPRWRRVLTGALNTNAGTLPDWLPWVVAMHDIGKISAAFQSLNKEQMVRLKQEGFPFDGWNLSWNVSHAVISQIFMAENNPQTTDGLLNTLESAWSEALGGHHGRYLHPDNEIKSARRKLTSEPTEWQNLRHQADSVIRSVLFKCNPAELSRPTNISTAIMAITGFSILCDWLGSDGRYFQPTPDAELSEYIEKSRQCAERAVSDSGLSTSTASLSPFEARALFSDLRELRPLQLAIDDIPMEILHSSSLSIIEAPTGEGKTEAALALAHRIAGITGTDELYYALPTMATSNQMFVRLQKHLLTRLGLAASVKLVHGQSFLMEDDLRAETPVAFIEPLDDGSAANRAEPSDAVTWFNSKKRAILAPFGVGTVDQAELASLNVKHAALRMMGLAGKIVIVDEVHAYDTYMTTVIERLLKWLSMLNTSVILLSATLPRSRRRRLAEAYGTTLHPDGEQEDDYPSLLVMSGKDLYHASPNVWQTDRSIELAELHLGDDTAKEKAEWLLKTVMDGGCACWITNTVKRAQNIFAILLEITPQGIDLNLLHSQFPMDERQRFEKELTDKYGSCGNRPERGIVVGTQVLEQSLDIDFDVMVSDLAPIDLVLQRSGRLHRHERTRPTAHAAPRLWINYESTPEGDLKSGSDRSIYAEYIMRQTQRILAGRERICLPADYRTLIEKVYSDQAPPEESPFFETWEDLQSKEKIATREAEQRLLPAPHPRDSFAKIAAMQVTFEEDENRADWIVAQTRLGQESLSIIPLERDGDWAWAPGGDVKISGKQEAPRDVQRMLLQHNLHVGHRDVIDAIKADRQEHPTGLFEKSSLLKGYYPLWLTNGKAEFELDRGSLLITLDPNLGLVIEKESKRNEKSE